MAIIAAFSHGATKAYTKPAYQYDKGQKLIITGIELPETFEVHISDKRDGGMAAIMKGHLEGTMIPDAYFVSGEYIYLWICLEDSGSEETQKDQSTEYEIVIPVTQRSIPIGMIGGGRTVGYIVDDNETLIPV